MREIIVGDVDKRIATSLQAQQVGDPAYLTSSSSIRLAARSRRAIRT
jgi:hypothetical protein